MKWVIDLDGVIWRGDSVIDGAPRAIQELESRGGEAFYVTNNSALDTKGYRDKLASMGIESDEAHIVHAGHAVASLIAPGSRVLRCAGDGIAEALHLRQCELIDVAQLRDATTPQVDAVVIGVRHDFEFNWLRHAAQATLQGARLIAPSADPLYVLADGFHIGGGALAATVSYATGVEAITAGKPFAPMTNAVRERVGDVGIVIGDQTRTDGRLAQQLEAPFGYVRSGAPVSADTDGVAVQWEGKDIGEVVEQVLA